ncbi:SDR family NAD(P)-dependent oxidoreductase [Amycolatopsis sp. PS_44_ISF1]|uniref:SDR family oxidoreductase n=1 Tax=Amycolatopsis sp. PS_44_ISF1 TaxID=2974917 RepID=UPI0028DFE6A0|nr:SDR family NAD(P)-dependent oxidoreductase [Amycolatopsis sp. PS_44_ISF1]MDT8912983.1 SDR family NAD(P)-dependent oxidoreductase [Amycolatopsis sp. PS_44_ISF1]
MELTGRVVALTGAAHGIGAAMARRFALERTAGIVVSDLDGEGARRVAEEITGRGGRAIAVTANAASKKDIRMVVDLAREAFGPVDLFCANAGVAFGTGVHAADTQWEQSWAVNVMQHVHAAQAVLPEMLARGDGHLLITASGAGLVGAPGDAPYTVTKHAVIGLAEWLATTYRTRGIRVSALCPLGVRTAMLEPGIAARHPTALAIAGAAPLLEPEEIAAAVVRGLAADEFLILPHESVRHDFARKAAAPDAWIAHAANRKG